MTDLWLPYSVPELAPALGFYRDRLGLAVVAAGSAFVELVSPVVPGPVPVAFEVRGPAGATVMVWSER